MTESGLNPAAVKRLHHDWDSPQELPGPSFASLNPAENPIYRAASRDKLTDLYTRESMMDYIRLLANSGKPFAIVFADLNNFGDVNKTRGHQEGDRLLIKAGVELSQIVQQYESDPELAATLSVGRGYTPDAKAAEERRKHREGRWGGDEFIVAVDLEHIQPENRTVFMDGLKADLHSLDDKDLAFAVGYSISEGQGAEQILSEADANMRSDKAKLKSSEDQY